MKATKNKIQSLFAPYVRQDGKGQYLARVDAECILDRLFEEYADISSQYITGLSGKNELVIKTIRTKAELFRIRIQ